MPESTQKVKFKRGQSGTMPALEAGSLLVQTDTGDIFLDNTDSDRIQLGDSRKLALSGGTMTGPINMGGQKITNVGNPTENTDVANKIFVDTAFQTLESEMGTTLAGYLQLKGGTMSGVLNMGGHSIENVQDPQADDEAANKGYVDSQISGLSSVYVPLSGGTLTGPLVLSGNPTQSNQAANKQYVDDAVANASSPSAANQFLTATAAATATKTITGTRPSSGSVFFVLFQNGVTASSGTFTFSFSVGGVCSVSGGSGFPPMPTISMPAWTMGTFYMNSATTAKFLAYTNYIDDGVVS